LEPLRRHIAYCLYSGFVENKPRDLSTLIVAYPERGKSTEAKRFNTIGAMEVQDLSSWGILHMLMRMPPKERDMFHHIIVPDLEKLASRSKRLKEELLSTIRILAEEGFERSLVRTQMFDFEKSGKRALVGFILCTTPEDIGDRRSAFRSYSFLSRFIPFTYDFSEGLKIDILRFVEDEENMAKDSITFKREEKTRVECQDHYKEMLNPYVDSIAREIDKFSKTSGITSLKDRERKFGIRLKENLITYLKSIALYNGYEEVRRIHFEAFKLIFPFMNFKFNNIDEDFLTSPFPDEQGTRSRRILDESISSEIKYPLKTTAGPSALPRKYT
jgi:hypothetical protein